MKAPGPSWAIGISLPGTHSLTATDDGCRRTPPGSKCRKNPSAVPILRKLLACSIMRLTSWLGQLTRLGVVYAENETTGFCAARDPASGPGCGYALIPACPERWTGRRGARSSGTARVDILACQD